MNTWGVFEIFAAYIAYAHLTDRNCFFSSSVTGNGIVFVFALAVTSLMS